MGKPEARLSGEWEEQGSALNGSVEWSIAFVPSDSERGAQSFSIQPRCGAWQELVFVRDLMSW